MGPVLTCDVRTARGLARVMRWADLWGPGVRVRAATPEDAIAGGDVRLALPDGRVLWNARALAEVRRGAMWAWLVRRFWLAGELAEVVWRLGAALGPALVAWSLVMRGESLLVPRMERTRALVLRVIGIAAVCAAVSWWVQAPGLVGEHGITPAAEWLDGVRAYAARRGESTFTLAPTWLWLDASDRAIGWTCALTALGGALLALGWLSGWAALLAFAGYLSLVVTGGVFMGYQWDALMLEALVVAMLLAPWTRRTLARAGDLAPPRAGVALARVVAFKLYFMSGLVKILSGDPVWADWTALDYHLWTQPLPSPTSFIALGAPAWALSGLTAFTLFAELVLPWALLLPAPMRRARVVATVLMLALQVGIAATGNFGYFNILSFGILLAGLDDGALAGWGRRARGWRPPTPRPRLAGWRAWMGLPRALMAGALVVVILFEVRQVWTREPPPDVVADVARALAPFRISNTYGLFANMTTTRPEIEIQGSDDGLAWQTYDFAWKPDHERDAPRFAGPHMPRLDWQLWFAALAGSCERARGYLGLVRRLLEAEPSVIALLARSPFGDRPPAYIRSLLWEYAPAPPGGDAWWIRQDARAFCPDLTWRNGRLQRVHFGPAPSATDGPG